MSNTTDQLTTESNFKATTAHEGAICTGRVLDNQTDQEWRETCHLDGKPVHVFYEFTELETFSGDVGYYPWDFYHVTKIESVE